MVDPFLSVTEDTGTRHVPLVPLAICRLGRSQGSDIVLTDVAASREHAMLRRDASGQCFIVDLGSRNGTLLNNRPVTAPTKLSNNDVISVGRQEIRFSDPGAVPSPPTAQFKQVATADATMFIAQQSLITVLVIDIRGFTPLAREIGEERISALMTYIFRSAGEILERAHCWSEKFIGDAVMAVWRHGGDYLMSSDLAAVLEVVRQLQVLFSGLQDRFGLSSPLVFGGAVNTGLASIGNMGSGNSSDFTALGDTVNKAFRLETASKQLDADLVMSEAVMRALRPPLPPTMLPRATSVALKGYDSAQSVYVMRFAEIAPFRALVLG